MPRANEEDRDRNGRMLAWLQIHHSWFWLGWPVLVILSWLVGLAFVHLRLGWGVYWTWNAGEVLFDILLLFGPPAAVEAWIRFVRHRR